MNMVLDVEKSIAFDTGTDSITRVEKSHTTLCADFRQKATWLCDFLKTNSIHAKPWASEDLPIFSTLALENKNTILGELNEWIEVLQSNASQLDVVRQTEHRILWRVLNDFKLRFPNDLFSRLPDDSIVEVYTADNRQVYRSLNFLKICTYSLEEIYGWPWYELYERDEAFTKQSLGFLNRALKGELRGIVNEPLDSHWVAECKEGHSRRTTIQPTMLCFFENAMSELTGYLYAFRVLDSTTATPPSSSTPMPV